MERIDRERQFKLTNKQETKQTYQKRVNRIVQKRHQLHILITHSYRIIQEEEILKQKIEYLSGNQ
jgi:hypothetical protein